MNIVGQLEAQQSKQDPPALRPGETVRVHVKVIAGEQERTQVFAGLVLGMSESGNRAVHYVNGLTGRTTVGVHDAWDRSVTFRIERQPQQRADRLSIEALEVNNL